MQPAGLGRGGQARGVIALSEIPLQEGILYDDRTYRELLSQPMAVTITDMVLDAADYIPQDQHIPLRRCGNIPFFRAFLQPRNPTFCGEGCPNGVNGIFQGAAHLLKFLYLF